jgi:hypothetical protein
MRADAVFSDPDEASIASGSDAGSGFLKIAQRSFSGGRCE